MKNVDEMCAVQKVCDICPVFKQIGSDKCAELKENFPEKYDEILNHWKSVQVAANTYHNDQLQNTYNDKRLV